MLCCDVIMGKFLLAPSKMTEGHVEECISRHISELLAEWQLEMVEENDDPGIAIQFGTDAQIHAVLQLPQSRLVPSPCAIGAVMVNCMLWTLSCSPGLVWRTDPMLRSARVWHHSLITLECN